ncbi:uncharacterized protein LOC124267116 [Haliotis rubra]|uniref:uncharacterized protein LOC124267116 n=1 Tax=Haliotis rubra TaxID=36100 RepID=UPI001EE50BB3|nr:uncharacterized protein LOC124267116 [Haliotis rubra]
MQENTCTVLETGTQKSKRRLIDSYGYIYVGKRENTKQTNWRCSVRNKKNSCPATATQKGTSFTPSDKPHNHTSILIKEDATNELLKSAATIVEDAVTTIVEPDAPSGARENMDQLTRIANRARERNRPKDPQDLDFEISTTFIPVGSLKADLTNKSLRHLILATDRQLLQLSKSKQWFLDGTFKVVKRPFYQLLSVHSFVRSKQDVKMMPLVFVIMSSRTKSDYVKVFNKLLDLLPVAPSVESIVIDFEAAAWGALKTVMPDVRLRGCLFHYTQAVWHTEKRIKFFDLFRN